MRSATGRIHRAAGAFAAAFLLAGCSDAVRIHTDPAGAEVLLDGRSVGTVPEGGTSVPVEWWALKKNKVEIRWPGRAPVFTELKRGVGEPGHTGYLVADGVGLLFFVVPGVVAFCFNGVGPQAEQHFSRP